MVAPIEDVQHFRRHGPGLVEAIADLPFQPDGFIGTKRIVLAQQARPKVTRPQAGKAPAIALIRDAGCTDDFNRAGM